MKVDDELEQSLKELPDDDREQLSEVFAGLVQLVQATAAPLKDEDRRLLIGHVGRALEGVGCAVIVGTAGSGKSSLFSSAPGKAEPERDRPSLAELVKQN